MMKKLVVLLLTFALAQNSFAQVSVTEDNDIKNFRFGLQGGISFDWLNIDDEKKFKRNGVGIGTDIGLQIEFKLNSTVSILTGISYKINKLKINYSDASSAKDTYYMLNTDADAFKEFDSLKLSTNKTFLLKNRTVKANYINIPIGLKLKTNEIGYLTYYGQVGVNIGFLTKARSNDEVDLSAVSYDTISNSYIINNSNIGDNTDFDIQSSLAPIRMGALIGGGAEYNISGNTSAFLTIQYNHYFTNAFNKEKNEEFLRKLDSNNQWQKVGAKVFPGSVSITLGILF